MVCSSIKAEDGGVLGFTPKVDASTSVSVVYSHAGYEAQTCDDWQNQANTEMGNINIYDGVYFVCCIFMMLRPCDPCTCQFRALQSFARQI